MDKETLEQKLTQAFKPLFLQVEDESHHHAGHAGVLEKGGSHFAVVIVSNQFDAKNKVARQRMVYEVLSDEMKNQNRSGIHALRMQTFTEKEWHDQQPY